jgi:hypothetical protein
VVLDPAAAITAREPGDRRQERLDQPATRFRIAGFGRDDQVPLLRVGEGQLVQLKVSRSQV